MSEKAGRTGRQAGAQVLLVAFAFALVVFVALSAVLVYQNFELSRRIDGVIQSQAEIKAQAQELQKEIERLNSLFVPKSVKKISSRLRAFGHLGEGDANYLAAVIYIYSMENRLDPLLVYSVICVESSFRPGAVSLKGATGLMQVMPSWADAFDIPSDDLFHPAVNVWAGTKILRGELERLKRLDLALKVYVSGKPYVGRGYVERVLGVYKKIRGDVPS